MGKFRSVNMIGKTISNYKILEKLGEGGMGEVYLAQDTKLGRKVALKFLPSEYTSQLELKTRFMREARAAAALNHPNIITIHEVAEYEARPFIAMEYVEGESLKDLIARKELSIGEVLDMALQISEGLAVAHGAQIVHRDIKPQNILMGKDGRVRICDFGLAKAKRDATLTQAGSTLGTIAYMSPEQAQGKEADHRSDIFSFGVVLYETVTGQLPFRGEHEAAVVHSIVNDTPEPLARYKSDVSGELQRIVGKAMEKNREMRYQHSDDLRADLGRLKTELETGVTKTLETSVKIMPSIAVLPFTNLSADKEQEYFCDGMAEDIINALTHIEGLRVVARTSAFAFKSKHEDIREIGRKLNVETLLEGSVRKAGSRLRITAQLVNVTDGYHLWSERYDREMEDVFAIQDEISLAIVNKLKLLVGEKAKLVRRHTDDLEAYNLYLKGRWFWNRRTEAGLKKAIEYLKQAIGKDPSYVLPYTGLADCYNILGWYGYLPPKKAFPRAKAAAEKSLEMDDTLAEAHTSLATVREFYDWDWLAAEREYKRAIERNPSYAPAHHRYAEYLSYMGRHEESIAEVKRATELDPLSLIINAVVGEVYYFARQYDQAIEASQRVIEMDPSFVVAHFLLAFPYAQKAMYDEAIAEAQKAMDLAGGRIPLFVAQLGTIYSYSGKRDEAEKVLDQLHELSKQRYVSPFYIALIYVGIGQKDQAFEWLEKAYDEHDHALETLKVDPMLDSVRSDPRFTELLKRMGLEK
ncbi:MAG: protein kinase [Candidatus Zixiibacteriota bacterium]